MVDDTHTKQFGCPYLATCAYVPKEDKSEPALPIAVGYSISHDRGKTTTPPIANCKYLENCAYTHELLQREIAEDHLKAISEGVSGINERLIVIERAIPWKSHVEKLVASVDGAKGNLTKVTDAAKAALEVLSK